MAGVYIHIPFCKTACHYCNFHFSTLNKHDEILNTIIQEIEINQPNEVLRISSNKNRLGNLVLEASRVTFSIQNKNISETIIDDFSYSFDLSILFD